MLFYLIRKPVFDQHQHVIGYEIVYRNENNFDEATDYEYEEGTSKLLLNSYLDVGMDMLLNGRLSFIPFDQDLLLKDSPVLLNSTTTIIKISSEVAPTDSLIEKIQQFKSDGYLISIDHYRYDYPHKSFLALCDIVQVDFSICSSNEIKNIAESFKQTSHILMAANLHDDEAYRLAKKVSFELFEGYYFCRPSLTKGLSLEPSNFSNIELLKLANAPSPDIKMISNRIEEDVTLTVKLLRLVNSSHFFMNKIHSVQHALAMLGMDTVRNWLNIVLMDSFLDSKSPEIIKISMVRMRLMASIGKLCKMDEAVVDSLKLIGLLSTLDVLLDKDIMEAVNPLPIERELKITLFGRSSKYSNIYKLVLNYERGVFNAAKHYAEASGTSLDAIPALYMDALKWADERYNLIYASEA